MASPAWRRAWPLFALATVVGLGLLVQWPLQAIRDYRTFRVYEPTVCTVLATRAVPSSTSGWIGGRTFRHDHFLPEVTVQYLVDGRSYTSSGYDNYGGRMSDASALVSFTVNAPVACRYDPARPDRAVVARAVSWAYYGSGVIALVLTLIPGNFLLVALRTRPRPVTLSTSAEVAGGEVAEGPWLPLARFARKRSGRRLLGGGGQHRDQYQCANGRPKQSVLRHRVHPMVNSCPPQPTRQRRRQPREHHAAVVHDAATL